MLQVPLSDWVIIEALELTLLVSANSLAQSRCLPSQLR